MIVTEIVLTQVLKSDPEVSAIVNGRVFPVMIPQGETIPSVTYQRISSVHEHTLQGYAHVENPRIQVDCWAETYNEAKSLFYAVKMAIFASPLLTATLISDEDIFEDGALIYRVSGDFSIWNTEA
jgi:hypothetical protein